MLTKQQSRWYRDVDDSSESVVQQSELLGIAVVVIMVMMVRMTVPVHLSVVMS